MQNVTRPTAAKKKIHSKNEFELCYLRHQYLRRVKDNPTEEQMKPFLAIIVNLAKNTYYTYRNLFRSVGFEVEDVINIGKVHLVSFLGLYSMEKMSQKYDEFVTKHYIKKGREPNENDTLDKNKANLTMFIKQRMEDVVRVCRQKARNIKGMPTEDYYVFVGSSKPPKNTRLLLEDHEKLGFKKLDTASYKTIKKRQKIKEDKPFKFAGAWYIAVHLEKRNLSIADFTGADLDPYDSIHNKTPEEILIMEESEERFEENKLKFMSHNDTRKMAILRKFINENKKNPIYRDEIKLAQQYIKDLRD